MSKKTVSSDDISDKLSDNELNCDQNKQSDSKTECLKSTKENDQSVAAKAPGRPPKTYLSSDKNKILEPSSNSNNAPSDSEKIDIMVETNSSFSKSRIIVKKDTFAKCKKLSLTEKNHNRKNRVSLNSIQENESKEGPKPPVRSRHSNGLSDKNKISESSSISHNESSQSEKRESAVESNSGDQEYQKKKSLTEKDQEKFSVEEEEEKVSESEEDQEKSASVSEEEQEEMSYNEDDQQKVLSNESELEIVSLNESSNQENESLNQENNKKVLSNDGHHEKASLNQDEEKTKLVSNIDMKKKVTVDKEDKKNNELISDFFKSKRIISNEFDLTAEKNKKNNMTKKKAVKNSTMKSINSRIKDFDEW